MNILTTCHPQAKCVLASSPPLVKKTDQLYQSVANNPFVSPLDALPVACSYVTVQLEGVRTFKSAYFSNNLFFGIDEKRVYPLDQVICWKPDFNEDFYAIA